MATRLALAATALAGAAWWLYRATAPADELEAEADDYTFLDDATASVDNFTGSLMETLSPVDPDQADTNVAAFLNTIRAAEGTAGGNGYRTLFGGSLFTGWADHPRIAKQFTDKAGRKLWTSAAGAYQFMAVSPIPTGGTTKVDTWDRLQRRLGLPDFSPASQDAAAVELIREAGALFDVRAGRFADAVTKVRKVWATATVERAPVPVDWNKVLEVVAPHFPEVFKQMTDNLTRHNRLTLNVSTVILVLIVVSLSCVPGLDAGEVVMAARLERESNPVIAKALNAWAKKALGRVSQATAAALAGVAVILGLMGPAHDARMVTGGEGGIRTHGTLRYA